jgi:hypothetical protein
MDGFGGSLRLGWRALLLQEDAYEEMRTSANPVLKGLVFIVLVGLAIALLNLIGTALEWASTPNLAQIKNIVLIYLKQMPWWTEAARAAPNFAAEFQRYYDLGWQIFPQLSGATNVGEAALGIIATPLGLVIRWLIYGVLAYLFARWLGGTGNLSETLGVLALAVAPQALNVLRVMPFVELGSAVAVWGILCAYVGLKKAHALSWDRAAWATALPFILVLLVVVLTSCLTSIILAALIGGMS